MPARGVAQQARQEREQRRAGRVVAAAVTRWLRRRQARRAVLGVWDAVVAEVEVAKLILGTGRLPSGYGIQRLCAAAVLLGYDAQRADLLTKVLNASITKARPANWFLHDAPHNAFWERTAGAALGLVAAHALSAAPSPLQRKFALAFLARAGGFAAKVAAKAGAAKALCVAVLGGVERAYVKEEAEGASLTSDAFAGTVAALLGRVAGAPAAGGPCAATPDALLDDGVQKSLAPLLALAVRMAPERYTQVVFYGTGRAEVPGWAAGDAPGLDAFWARVLPDDAAAAVALWSRAWGAEGAGVGAVTKRLPLASAADLEDPRLAAVEAAHALVQLGCRTLCGAGEGGEARWAAEFARPWAAVVEWLLAQAPPRSVLGEYFIERPEVEELLAAAFHTVYKDSPAAAGPRLALPAALCAAPVALKYDMFRERTVAERPPPPPSAKEKRNERRRRLQARDAARLETLAAQRDAARAAALDEAAAAKAHAAVSAQHAAARGALGEEESVARAEVEDDEAAARRDDVGAPSAGLRRQAAAAFAARRAAGAQRLATQREEFRTRRSLEAAAADAYAALWEATPFGAHLRHLATQRCGVESSEHAARARIVKAADAAADALVEAFHNVRQHARGGGLPAAGERYAIGDRKLLMLDGLKKGSDKVNNAALRKCFEPLGAIGVGVLVVNGKRTGQAVVEFNTETRRAAAMAQLARTTICESHPTMHPCTEEDFAGLPEAWRKGRPTGASPGDAPPGGAPAPPPPSRIAVVRADRCQYFHCHQECQKMCEFDAVGFRQKVVGVAPRVVSSIDELRCTACGLCVKRKTGKTATRGCPFNAITIVKVPKELAESLVTRYGRNGFALCKLPVPKPGKVLALVGENGAGKSTVLKVLAGRLTPNGGRALQGQEEWPRAWPDAVKGRFKGTELQSFITRLEAGGIRVAYKAQHVDRLQAAGGGLTVHQYLACDHAEPGRLAATLDALSLHSILDRPVRQLSGGEMQRVAVAGALLTPADLYLFDEPSSFLDVKQRLRVCETIRAGTVDAAGGEVPWVVCVEHDLAVCDYMADAVAVLHGTPGAFGVVSRGMNVRDGINAFLTGFLPNENVRIRPHGLDFRMHHDPEEAGVPAGAVSLVYPAASVTRGAFRLDIHAGSLKAGEVTAFVGENGCGKSTLLEALAGKVRPDGGAARLLSASACLKPQMVTFPQQEGLTVKAVLQGALGALDTSSERHQAVLEDVLAPLRIDDLMGLEVAKLSGGEMQRVALALALSAEADVVFIDEPSAFLDAGQRMAAAQAIRKVARRLKTPIVLVEHDLMMTSYAADAVVVFEGRPAVAATATAPEAVSPGMNRFLRQLDVTVRLDAATRRPRFNNKDSVLDREQRARGEYYAEAASIKDASSDGTTCAVCGYTGPGRWRECPRCGVRADED